MIETDVKRKIYGRNAFKSVVDTNFKSLLPKDEQDKIDEVNVDKFFDQYDQLFYEIPESGENSHLELINRSSEYLNISYQDLMEEIKNLREENVSLKNQLFIATNGNNG